MRYVIITPAHNEEQFIERVIQSMIAQTTLPSKWVVVDDGSTDRTAEIVENYAIHYPWIQLVRRPQRKDRNFAGKVHAFNAGLNQVQDLQVELIGNLDADISVGSDHFEFLLARFFEDPKLGVAGTAYTQQDWDSTRDSFEGQTSVAMAPASFSAFNVFRKSVDISQARAGGVDWMAVTTARMKGWKTRNYLERRYHHHRTMGTAERSELAAMFDYGREGLLPRRIGHLGTISRVLSND